MESPADRERAEEEGDPGADPGHCLACDDRADTHQSGERQQPYPGLGGRVTLDALQVESDEEQDAVDPEQGRDDHAQPGVEVTGPEQL